LSGRAVAGTPKSLKAKKLDNGDYVHLGLKQALQSRLKTVTRGDVSELMIDINIDGMTASVSSNLDVWPILGRCLNLVQDKPFAIGIFSGSSKPDPIEDYVADLIAELQTLLLEGIESSGKRYEIPVQRFIFDAPARAYAKCITGRTGKDGCERCLQEGEHDGSRVVFEPQVSAPRTDESFRCKVEADTRAGFAGESSPACSARVSPVSVFRPYARAAHGSTRTVDRV